MSTPRRTMTAEELTDALNRNTAAIRRLEEALFLLVRAQGEAVLEMRSTILAITRLCEEFQESRRPWWRQ
jgi:hypothetical protein